MDNKRVKTAAGETVRAEAERSAAGYSETSGSGTAECMQTAALGAAGYSETSDRVYQRTLTFVYLKAVRDVLGVRTTIFNSLTKGLYTELDAGDPVTDAQIEQIEAKMREYVRADAPIGCRIVTRQDVLDLLEKETKGSREHLALLKYATDVHYIAVYELDGYHNFFFGRMLPSAGPLTLFGLARYGDGVLLRYPHPSAPDRLPDVPGDDKLYKAFEQGWDIARGLGLRYAGDLDEEVEQGLAEDIIRLSERMHAAQIEDVSEQILSRKKRVILLAGPSSSGKTTTAKHFINALAAHGPAPLYLGTDDYFVERDESPLDENGEHDFEGLDAIDVRLFSDNINSLLAGDAVDLPVFDFLSGCKQFGTRITRLEKNQPILIEGLHALNPAMTVGLPDEEKYKIYISPLTQLNLDDHNRIPTTDVRLIRRMIRDHRTRGNSVTDTIKAWPKVRRGENIHVFPYYGEADAIFNSALLYELPVLRAHAEELLAGVTPDMEAYGVAIRLLDFLRFFKKIENEAAIPGDSVIREFIG
ncbi:MAG: nucleoside kinase [Clostridiales Family XIII bacterium]|nr:nucleoside kinase [Clostridiales Family XIII bacterium]